MKKFLLLGLSMALLLASCVKKKEAAPGESHLRFVNAIPGSYPQDVYINANKATSSLGYGIQSPYVTCNAGINDIGITNSGTSISNLTYGFGTENGDYATVYFFRDFNGALISGGVKDVMTAPPAGKARVRFLNLHNYLQTSFTMSKSDGTSLFTSLVFTTASTYYDVDPGTKFTATATTIASPVTIDFNPQAGKIYTVWINGSSATEFLYFSVMQNY